jgi:hypothetical protein
MRFFLIISKILFEGCRNRGRDGLEKGRKKDLLRLGTGAFLCGGL